VYKKRTLYLIAAFLLLEAAMIVALPSRVPRAVRALTAAINFLAAAALWLLSRQKRPGP
jgi:hypothetical protein